MQERGAGRLEELLEEVAASLRGSSVRNEEIAQILRQSERQASRLETVTGQLDDLAEESRAQSQAIFILIDRLTPPSD